MTVESDLFGGIVALLVAAGICSYRPDGSAYPAGETGAGYRFMPADPDEFLSIAFYGTTDAPQSDLPSRRLMQIKFRAADPRRVDDLGAAAFDVLHGLRDRTFGAVDLSQCLRISWVQLPDDEQSSRFLRADNYVLDL